MGVLVNAITQGKNPVLCYVALAGGAFRCNREVFGVGQVIVADIGGVVSKGLVFIVNLSKNSVF